MANWLHATTHEYRQSSDPPLAEQGEWVRNPTLPEGVDSWADCIVEDGVVRAPNEQEAAAQNAAKLAAAKVAKMAEIDAKTARLIEGGAVVVNGVAIKTEANNQLSLNCLQTLVGRGVAAFPQPVSAVGGGQYTITSQPDMDRIAGVIGTFVMTTKAAGRALRAQVLACETLAEVAAIVDDRS